MLTVVAGAGYGKSTLVSYWLETSDNPNAWVSLDATDNDLRLFLSYFLTAIQTIFPDFGRQLLDKVNASTLPPLSALIGSLINVRPRLCGLFNIPPETCFDKDFFLFCAERNRCQQLRPFGQGLPDRFD